MWLKQLMANSRHVHAWCLATIPPLPEGTRKVEYANVLMCAFIAIIPPLSEGTRKAMPLLYMNTPEKAFDMFELM